MTSNWYENDPSNDDPYGQGMQEKPKRHGATEGQCPICGGTSYTWGRTSRNDSGWLGFKSDDHPWLMPGREVRARECQSCGNVQLFTVE
jgi:hypothetical protein